jgi:hypothetical protein
MEERAADLVRQIISLCKDDQVRARIAAGSFEVIIGQLQKVIPEKPFFGDLMQAPPPGDQHY